jgi:hypothetical protein
MAGAIAASYWSRWAAWSRPLMAPKTVPVVHGSVSVVMTGHLGARALIGVRLSGGHTKQSVTTFG